MREVNIDVWCDIHGRGTRAIPSPPVTIGDREPMTLDLCDGCMKDLIGNLDHLLAEQGQPLDLDPRPKRRARKAIDDGHPEDARTCRYPVQAADGIGTAPCGHVAPNRKALGQHLRDHHGTGMKEEIAAGRQIPVPHGRPRGEDES